MVRFDPRDPGQIWVRRPDGVLVTAPAFAGRAAGDVDMKLAIDEAAQLRLDEETDRGFEATDRIEEGAAKATKAARRKAQGPNKPRTAASPPTPARKVDLPGDRPPMVIPQRNAIPVEIWN
jgi:putative transposase